MSYENVPKNLTQQAVLTRGGRPDYLKLAADPFPSPAVDEAGAILEETDTGDRYRWTSTVWVQTYTAGAVNTVSPVSATLDYYMEVAKGNVAGTSKVHKYGRNPDIDIASGFEAIWDGGGTYTGHDCIVAETLETYSSSALDVGTLVSSGTATGGTATTLVDTGATFVSDGVVVGDLLLDDTHLDHAILTGVTETTLTFRLMHLLNEATVGDAYRVVTQASTGSAVVKLGFLLDNDFANETSEFIILNGTTPVDTVGTYLRHSRGKTYLGTNAGDITTRQKTTTANVTMILPIGYNSTMTAAYTIPAGKRAFIVDWFAAVAKKSTVSAEIKLLTTPVGGNKQVSEELALVSVGSGYINRKYTIPKDAIKPMTDIVIEAEVDTNNSGIAAGFDLVLIDI